MEAYGGRHLLDAPLLTASSKRSGAAFWWTLSALLAVVSIASLLVPEGKTNLATAPSVQAASRKWMVKQTGHAGGLQMLPQGTGGVDTAYETTTKAVGLTKTMGSFQDLPTFPALAAGTSALCALVIGVAHRWGKPQGTQVAMAPLLGIAQPVNPPVDKGGDPNDQGTDARTERHRIEQRVIFNAERWRKHRSGSRFSRALLTMPQSYVVQHVVNPVIAISLCTAVLCAAQLYIGTEVFNLPTSLFSLSAPSLGLLLVFRTNASYERWDGARKMIGLVKNRSEDLVRQVCVRFPTDRADLKEQMLRYIQAFFFALKVHLRSGPGGFEDDSNLIEDLTPILKAKELELLLQSTNRPAHIMNCMTQIVKEAKLEGGALMCLDQNLTQLADVLGGCERILRTPIPLSYTRMTTRFLFVWLLLLPLALSGEIMRLDHSIWLTIPAVSFIAFGLLGVEEVGVQIEEPFSILPMEGYALGSKNNTQSIFAQMNAVAEVTKLSK